MVERKLAPYIGTLGKNPGRNNILPLREVLYVTPSSENMVTCRSIVECKIKIVCRYGDDATTGHSFEVKLIVKNLHYLQGARFFL